MAINTQKEKDFLFSKATVGSPLEELQSVFKKKCKTFTNLGEEAKVNLYKEAYELARTHLATFLSEEY